MGILNITPILLMGVKFTKVIGNLSGKKMLDDGATFIDVGAYSIKLS
jgi:dihydropteroate synthase